MSRNNQSRLKAPQPAFSADPVGALAPTQINISVPSEFVELPSHGLFYPPNHPLYQKETIEIKHMTAKEEDILTSEALIKKGIVLDRLIQSIVLDRRIDPSSILICDRNAILIAARASAYGNDYEASVVCPACRESNEIVYDLGTHGCEQHELPDDVTVTERGTLRVMLPKSGKLVEFRLLTGHDENSNISQDKSVGVVSDQMRRVICSVDSNDDPGYVRMFAENMPAFDSRFLRNIVKQSTPSTDLKLDLVCNSCGNQAEVEVPIGTRFFWPDAQVY